MHTYLPIEKLLSLGQLEHYALENTVNYGELKTRFSQYYYFFSELHLSFARPPLQSNRILVSF